MTSPAELASALSAAGAGDVDAGDRRRAEYATDASNYRVVPLAVAFPRDAGEVAAALRAARERGLPVTCRGGGTSIAGNSVGAGLVLDFSRHMNRVLAVDADARTATAEPGAILDDITAAAAGHGLRFGPDPSTHARATIAGSLGNNACGARALGYGRTADAAREIELITADGGRLTARRYGRAGLAAAGDIGRRLEHIVAGHLAVIREEFGHFPRQVSGYSLEHLLPENGCDLARFLAGTEGTLGVITRATVSLVESPPAVALAVLGYPDMPAAAEAVPALLPHRPVALEGMDAQLVEVVRARGAAAVPALPRGGGWLFAEMPGPTPAAARAAASALIADADCLDSLVVTGGQAAALWRIREDGAGLGSRTPAGQPAWPGWEDAAVPPQQLSRYLRDFTALMAGYGFSGLVYGHFGDGCVHARIDFPLAGRPGRYRDFVREAAGLVGRYGGSLSGEHGDGRARSELLPAMYSPRAIAVFAAVKHAFDPDGTLNPGVIVDPAPLDADLRLASARPLRTALGFSYPADGGDLSAAVHRCVGVGKCRADTTAAGGVMCPSYLATRDEKDSTRGRSRVLQELAAGSLITGFRSAAVAEALELCLSCKGCSSDCPAGVDMATYKAEVLYQRYRRRIRPASHYALGWLPRWARAASAAPRLAGAALRQPLLAGAAKRLGGIDQRRDLPAFAPVTFRRWFSRHPPASGPALMLWVDTFTNYFTPEVGVAAVRVLESAGYRVQILREPACCGLTWISTGQLDGARRRLRRTLRALEPAIEQGTGVVGLEPSCTAVLRRDAADLLPGDGRARAVGALARTLAEVLLGTPGWQPPPMADVHGIAQPHCHQHAVMGWQPDAALLARAGARISPLGGCCGLAGNFGAERGHYDVSVAVAQTALLPAVRGARDGAVVLADGFSCRTQLGQLAGTRGIHLAELLAGHLGDQGARRGQARQPDDGPDGPHPAAPA